MNLKSFLKENPLGIIIWQFFLAVIIIVALSWLTLFLIDIYTHHGEVETVPDMKGLYLPEAEEMLANHDLYPVIIDSVYDKNKKHGTIVEQNPAPNSTIKKNRPVYLIINAKQTRQIPVPDVTDLSYRQADALITSTGLKVENVEYRPSEYKNLVIEMKYRGLSIPPGTKIPEGSSIVLVVGSGLGEGTTLVPLLKGMTLEDARAILIADSLITGAIEYDVQPNGDQEEYIIYRQQPSQGKYVPSGTRIDLWLSKDKALLQKELDDSNSQDDTEEEFF